MHCQVEEAPLKKNKGWFELDQDSCGEELGYLFKLVLRVWPCYKLHLS